MPTPQNKFIDLTLEQILILDTMQQGISHDYATYHFDRDMWFNLSYFHFINRFAETRRNNRCKEIWVERISFVYPLLARIPIEELDQEAIVALAHIEDQYVHLAIHDITDIAWHHISEQIRSIFARANQLVRYGKDQFNFPTTSKLLHFMCPQFFPIFDHRICRILYGNDQLDDFSKYIGYMDALHRYLTQGVFSYLIMQEAKEKEVSPLRIIDLKLLNLSRV